MRALLLAVLVLAAGASGCATPTPASSLPPADAPDDATPEQVILHDCLEHATDIPVEMAEVQRFLPQGMKPAPFGPAGLAVLEVISVDCKAPIAGEDGARAFIAWTIVEPPERLRGASVSLYLYLFAMTTDDAAVAQALSAIGVPITLAPTTFGTDATPGHVAGHGTAKTEGWTAALETQVPKREVLRSHPIFRLFVGNATGVTGAFDVDGGSHPHYDAGEGRLVLTGKPPFPAPTTPGLAVYGYKGHLGFLPVPLEHDA